MSLRTAQRASLVDQVIDQLKEQITSNSWQMHAKIPTETVLAEQLGVGRNTVREAVRALTHAGLLECRQGDGTYVRATSELSGAMLRRLRAAEQLEILEVRRALEVEAARLAATRRSDADIARIETALAERERAWEVGEPNAFVEADLAFHVAVVQATHNLVLIDLYEDFSAALRASITAAGTSLNSTYIPHEAIARAIAAGDVSAAERAGHACMEHILIALTDVQELSSPDSRFSTAYAKGSTPHRGGALRACGPSVEAQGHHEIAESGVGLSGHLGDEGRAAWRLHVEPYVLGVDAGQTVQQELGLEGDLDAVTGQLGLQGLGAPPDVAAARLDEHLPLAERQPDRGVALGDQRHPLDRFDERGHPQIGPDRPVVGQP